MTASTTVPVMGWTKKSVGATMLALVAEQRAKSAARLVELLEARQLSQEALAREAGISTKTVSRWKNQRHDPDRATVEAVAEVLKVEPDWLWEPPAPLGLDVTPTVDRLQRIEALLTALVEHAGLSVEAILADAELRAQANETSNGPASQVDAASPSPQEARP